MDAYTSTLGLLTDSLICPHNALKACPRVPGTTTTTTTTTTTNNNNNNVLFLLMHEG